MYIEKSLVQPYLRPLAPRPSGKEPKGRPTVPIKCLLCDIYGTLFISGSGDIGIARQQKPKDQTLEALIARYSQTLSAPELLTRLYATITRHHAQAEQRGITYPEVQIDKIWSQIISFQDHAQLCRFAVEFEMIMNPVWPMPGLQKLLQRCREKGIHLGIISNAQFFTPQLFQWFFDADLSALGFDPLLTILSYEHGRAKPSPALFSAAAKRLASLKVAPKNVAYLGNDMRNDIVPAQSAGFQSILFAGDARSLRLRKNDPRCRTAQPDMIITELAQLIPCL